jgi:cyclic-di-GMP-binding protein
MSDHPIAHINSLSNVKDCVAILSVLSLLGNREGPFTLDRLQQLIAVEAHFRALLRREQIAYFSAVQDESRKGETDAFAKQMQLIHSHLASAFQRYVMRHEAWSESGLQSDLLYRTTGLAAANFGALVKWGYFLHETLKGTSWTELHALYYFAEGEGFHQIGLNIYAPATGYLPSVEALYLRALMLDVINAGSLSIAQIEIAEGWLSEWCADYALEAQYSPRSHLIYVDLAEHSGFHVMVPGVQGDTIRYLRADALGTQIEDVKNELRSGRLYSGRGGTSDFPMQEHVALLSGIERLYHSILARSGNRVEERVQAADLEVEVEIGLEAILKVVSADRASAANAGLSLQLLDPGGAAQKPDEGLPKVWKVHDFSSHGYGLLIERSTGERVALHNLIALRSPGKGHWALGTIVRKLSNRIQGQTLFGVEIMSYRPLPVPLIRVAPDRAAPTTDGVGIHALYVAGKDNDGRRDFLVLRLSDFVSRNVFELLTHGAYYRVRLNRAVKKGADWIALRFEVDNKR